MTKDKLSAAREYLKRKNITKFSVERGRVDNDSRSVTGERWDLETLLTNFAKEQVQKACKEQREICADAVPNRANIPINIKISVRNAPSPE